MVDIIKKYNLNNALKYEFFKANNNIQSLICRYLFLIELKDKTKNTTKDILNNIECNLINKNKVLIEFKNEIENYGTKEDILKDKEHTKKLKELYNFDEKHQSKYSISKEEYIEWYNNKLTMYKYYMYCLIYDIQNIQSLFEIYFINKEIDKVERFDYTDYDDYNNNFIIEDDYYNHKYNLFSKKHYIIKDLFNNDYNEMIESSYKNVYSECSNFIITNDSLILTLYSTEEEDEEEDEEEIKSEIEDLIDDIIIHIEEDDNNYTDEEIIFDIVQNLIFTIEENDYFDNL
jgi:hypothetical protein